MSYGATSEMLQEIPSDEVSDDMEGMGLYDMGYGLVKKKSLSMFDYLKHLCCIVYIYV